MIFTLALRGLAWLDRYAEHLARTEVPPAHVFTLPSPAEVYGHCGCCGGPLRETCREVHRTPCLRATCGQEAAL